MGSCSPIPANATGSSKDIQKGETGLVVYSPEMARDTTLAYLRVTTLLYQHRLYSTMIETLNGLVDAFGRIKKMGQLQPTYTDACYLYPNPYRHPSAYRYACSTDGNTRYIGM